MKVNEMLYYKQLYGYSYDQLSALSGVPKGTIQKILTGVTLHPRFDTLQALEKVLRPEAMSELAAADGFRESDAADAQTAFHEEISPDAFDGTAARNLIGVSGYTGEPVQKRWDRQGSYTVEDYYALPEDDWVELIDGVFYDMTAPSPVHQIIGFQIAHQIENFIDGKGGDCITFVAPCDVQIDCDDRTMVQPDLFVLCDRRKLIDRCIYGAPDFVVEVLSRSTSRKDRYIKFQKYHDAGVREYWMIDPFKEQVIVHLFHSNDPGVERADCIEDETAVYTFSDLIPIGIYGGELEIDFSKIADRISGLVR